jgi:hypothetical protein
LIRRLKHLNDLKTSLERYPVVALLGTRQCGKSTLARQFASTTDDPVSFFDLEDPTDVARLDQPRLALESLTGLVILDEAQRKPDLFSLLRVLADRQPLPCRFLILGSVSPQLRQQSAESLAGRVRYLELGGFDISEINVDSTSREQLWLRGGYPRSFLSNTDEHSLDWRRQFIRTFLELDLSQLGFSLSVERMRRFWSMIAHYQGQTWNAAEIAGSLGVSAPTATHYLDVLTAAMMVRQVGPWFENVGKRTRRAPKIYLRDSGLFHALQGIADWSSLEAHPKLGASWDGFAIEQIHRWIGSNAEPYYWSLHSGAEIDLLLTLRGQRIGFEFKYADAPRLTKSLHSARTTLNLDWTYVVVPNRGSRAIEYPLEPRTWVVDLPSLAHRLGFATSSESPVR